MRRLLAQLNGTNNNDEMVSRMVDHGTLHTKQCIKAFRACDRGGFFLSDTDAVYVDMPLRQGLLHLSAPSIYATALEALHLEEGVSFLNVGSGTGYLSSLVASIVGSDAVHHGVEIHQELIDHARSKLDALGHTQVQLVCGNCFALDPATSLRFDRIYVGAGASQQSAAIIFRMLRIGGIVVGPFAGSDGAQRLLRARRVSETEFEVRELMSVQFTPLVPPSPAAAREAPLVSLPPPCWSPLTNHRFPRVHRKAVRTLLLVHARADTFLGLLPKDVLMLEVLPRLAFDAFTGGGLGRGGAGGGGAEALDTAPLAAAAAARAVSGAGHYGFGVGWEEDDDDDDDEEEEEEEDEDGEEGEGAQDNAEVATDAAPTPIHAPSPDEAPANPNPAEVPAGGRALVMNRARALARVIRMLAAGAQAAAGGSAGGSSSSSDRSSAGSSSASP